MKKILLRLLTVITAFSMLTFLPTTIHAQEVSDFNFDVWHDEAMQAYDTYISLVESKVDDSTWKNVFDYAEITRVSVKKIYLESVKNATEEELNTLSQADVIDYFTTYLNFVLVKDRSNDYYDSHFKSGETAKQNYFKDSVGLNMWTGNGSEELINTYMTVADYQLQYFEYYGFPYNFHNNKSYADETGLEIIAETTENEEIGDLESLGLTEEEIAEIESEINAENSNNEDSNSINPLFIIIPIVLLLAISGYIIFSKKNKKKDQ